MAYRASIRFKASRLSDISVDLRPHAFHEMSNKVDVDIALVRLDARMGEIFGRHISSTCFESPNRAILRNLLAPHFVAIGPSNCRSVGPRSIKLSVVGATCC